MFASSLLGRTRAFARRSLPLLAVFGALTLGACSDDDDDNGTGPNGVNGMWETSGMYLHVSSSTLTFYLDFDGACYLPIAFDVADIDGNTYTLEVDGDVVGEAVLTRSGSTLTVEIDGEELVFESSNVNPTSLEICDDLDPSEFNPTLGACTSYPSMTLGVAINGTLANTDDTDPSGFHYDAYRLQLASASTVEISHASDDVDAYAFLYSSAGALIAWDDDNGDGLDALITADLGAGCYIVVASSFDPGETGAYQLVANAF